MPSQEKRKAHLKSKKQKMSTHYFGFQGLAFLFFFFFFFNLFFLVVIFFVVGQMEQLRLTKQKKMEVLE